MSEPKLFKMPVGVSDQFSEAYLNPTSVSFAAKWKAPDGTYVPILYLTSGMKLAVSDEMYADVVNSYDIVAAGQIPKGIRDAFEGWPKHLDNDE